MPLNHTQESVTSQDDKLRILIIEDDVMMSEFLESFFEMSGYQCIRLPHSHDILKSLAVHQPHLLIVDYLLPGPNGGVLSRQLKDNANTAHIPVLLCSAYPEEMLPLASFGCDAFLAKPFALDELEKIVRKLLLKG